MNKQIELFQKLQRISNNILLGGSCVLDKYGLINRPVKDLDIICGMENKRFREFVLCMSLISPCKTGPYYYPEGENREELHYRFNMDGIDVFVFVYQIQRIREVVNYNSVNEVKVKEIIKAKQRYIDEYITRMDAKRLFSNNPCFEISIPTPPPSIQKHIDDIKFYKMRQLEICTKFNKDDEFISNTF